MKGKPLDVEIDSMAERVRLSLGVKLIGGKPTQRVRSGSRRTSAWKLSMGTANRRLIVEGGGIGQPLQPRPVRVRAIDVRGTI